MDRRPFDQRPTSSAVRASSASGDWLRQVNFTASPWRRQTLDDARHRLWTASGK
jgi:hypothetical protein